MVSPPSSTSSEDDGANLESAYQTLDVLSAYGHIDHASATRSCHCTRNLSIQTLWDPTNAGRRFIECPKQRANSCNYFEWLDPEFPNRAKEVIWELYEQKNELLDVTAQLSTDLSEQMEELDRIKEDFDESKELAEFLSQRDEEHRKQLEISRKLSRRLLKSLQCFAGFTIAIVGFISALAYTMK